MTSIVFNFKDKDFSTGFDPLPEGEYVAQLVSCELRENKKRPVDSLNFRFDVYEPTEFKGRVVFDNASLEESSFWKLALIMKGLGIPYKEEGLAYAMETLDDGTRKYEGLLLTNPDENGKVFCNGFVLGDGNEFPFRDVPVVGATVKLTVGTREWEGKTYNTVKGVEIIGELPAASLTAESANSGSRPKLM